jgi:hypothetical protein
VRRGRRRDNRTGPLFYQPAGSDRLKAAIEAISMAKSRAGGGNYGKGLREEAKRKRAADKAERRIAKAAAKAKGALGRALAEDAKR